MYITSKPQAISIATAIIGSIVEIIKIIRVLFIFVIVRCIILDSFPFPSLTLGTPGPLFIIPGEIAGFSKVELLGDEGGLEEDISGDERGPDGGLLEEETLREQEPSGEPLGEWGKESGPNGGLPSGEPLEKGRGATVAKVVLL